MNKGKQKGEGEREGCSMHTTRTQLWVCVQMHAWKCTSKVSNNLAKIIGTNFRCQNFSPLSADGAVRGRDTTAVNSLGRNRFNCCSFSGF